MSYEAFLGDSPGDPKPIGLSLSLGWCTYSHLGSGLWFRHPDETARWWPEGVTAALQTYCDPATWTRNAPRGLIDG